MLRRATGVTTTSSSSQQLTVFYRQSLEPRNARRTTATCYGKTVRGSDCVNRNGGCPIPLLCYIPSTPRNHRAVAHAHKPIRKPTLSRAECAHDSLCEWLDS